MGIPIPGKDGLYIETGSRLPAEVRSLNNVVSQALKLSDNNKISYAVGCLLVSLILSLLIDIIMFFFVLCILFFLNQKFRRIGRNTPCLLLHHMNHSSERPGNSTRRIRARVHAQVMIFPGYNLMKSKTQQTCHCLCTLPHWASLTLKQPFHSCTQGPILHRVYELFNEILYKLMTCNYKSNDYTMSQICTCHDSWAFVTCAKLWHDHIIICQVISTDFVLKFGLKAFKIFVKWVLGVREVAPTNTALFLANLGKLHLM